MVVPVVAGADPVEPLVQAETTSPQANTSQSDKWSLG
jgi:hypothetical protein